MNIIMDGAVDLFPMPVKSQAFRYYPTPYLYCMVELTRITRYILTQPTHVTVLQLVHYFATGFRPEPTMSSIRM